jgi:hypothetical protein
MHFYLFINFLKPCKVHTILTYTSSYLQVKNYQLSVPQEIVLLIKFICANLPFTDQDTNALELQFSELY